MSFKRLGFACLFCMAVSAFAPILTFAQETTENTESDENWFYGKLIKSVSFKI